LPFDVPELPETVDYADLGVTGQLGAGRNLGATVQPGTGMQEGASSRDAQLLSIGLSAETGGTAHLDLGRLGRRVLVVGHPRSGRSTTLTTIGTSAVLQGRTVAVVESRGDRKSGV